MRRESWVCHLCNQHVENKFDRCEVRVEIRNVSHSSSVWSKTLDLRLCRPCAMTPKAQAKAEIVGQGVLL